MVSVFSAILGMASSISSYWVQLRFEDENCSSVSKPKEKQIKNVDSGWDTVTKLKQKQIAKLKSTFSSNGTTVILFKDSQSNEVAVTNDDEYTS